MTLQHILKNSSQSGKEPLASQLANGEIALNYHADGPFLTCKDTAGVVRRLTGVWVGASAPGSPTPGELWLDISITPNQLKVYKDSTDSWVFAGNVANASTSAVGVVELATDAETQAGSDTQRAVTPASLQSKISDSTVTVSATTIASSSAVKTTYDLANAALPKTGGTVTGALEIGTTGSLVFEGSTANDFETTLAVTDPTADRTITLPDRDGTVITSGDTGTVTSTMLATDLALSGSPTAQTQAAGTNNTTLATTAFVMAAADAARQGLTVKQACRAATTANITLSGTQTIDGVAVVAGDRVLVKSQSTAAENGIYICAASGWARATDFDADADLLDGAFTFVEEGTANADSGWVLTTNGPITVGVTSLAFVQFSGAGQITAGSGLSKDANTLSVASGGITSDMLADGTIVNADVNASAAIAGTKISPDFGSQTITTTGVVSAALGAAATPSITFTGDLNTGIYSPGADQVAISTNGTGRLFVDAGGNVGVKGSAVITTSAASAPTFQIGDGVGSPAVVMYSATTGASQISFADSTTGAGSYDGYILYNQNSQYLEFGTAANPRLRITSAGLVGIGTSSPSYTLDVATNIRAFTNSFKGGGASANMLFAVGGNSGELVTPVAEIRGYDRYAARSQYDGDLAIHTLTGSSSTEKVRIDYLGRVGIGTTSPNRKLEITGDTSVDNLVRVNGIGSVKSGIEFSSGGTVYAQMYFNNNSPFDLSILQQYTSGSLIFGTNSFERARIDSSGRLLVGTSSASGGYLNNNTLLHIQNGGAACGISIHRPTSLAPAAAPYIFLSRSRGTPATAVSSGDRLGEILFAGADGTDVESAAASIYAEVDGTPGASNDMPGRLVFSTTADGASSPTERVRIDKQGQLFTFFASGSNGITARSASAAGTTNFLYRGMNSGTDNTSGGNNVFYVYTNGNVQNTNNSYTAISDIKLKENIVDARSQWADIKALQVRNYNLKEGQTHRQIGLIAQEVEPISPGLVYETPDRDEDGNDLGTVTKSVNYSVLYMKAVKALQEAMERIEVLEQRLTDAGIA